MPSAVGYQPTLANELGALQERITSTRDGSITSGAGRLCACRRPDRPRPRHHLCPSGCHHRSEPVRSWNRASTPPWTRWIPPAASWKRDIVGEEHYRVARKVQATLQHYQELQDIIAILGMDELGDGRQADRCPRP